MMTFYNLDSDVRRNITSNYFFAYSTRYAGSFQILDSVKIPRPCAYKSFNLTSMKYYRGQNPTQYKISNQNSQGFTVTMMNEKSKVVLVNG